MQSLKGEPTARSDRSISEWIYAHFSLILLGNDTHEAGPGCLFGQSVCAKVCATGTSLQLSSEIDRLKLV